MKIFSVPLNPKLSKPEFYRFLDFLKSYKDWIYDIYFTSRVSPFNQDAMGDVFVSSEDHAFAIETALNIQKELGITVSATFNNIQVRPSQENLELWIKNFRPLYEAGVRSCTLPHLHWMATGQVKAEFPELFVKNTILRKLTTARELVAYAEAGFDYINVDRNLMRDKEALLEIKRAKEKTGVTVALLANEGCLGGCPMMEEHYEFNNTRTDGPQYFGDPISRVSCPKWDHKDPSVPLKTANLPPWREDWQDFLDNLGIDVFKMHGRETASRLWETVDLIKNYAAGKDILFDTFEDFIEESNLIERPINAWREKIRTCRFECWDCQFCDKIWAAKKNDPVNQRVQLVADALVNSVNRHVEVDIPGLTSPKVQQLLNYLGATSKKYLEVGVYLGATFCGAIAGNKLEAYAVDNWKENVQPANGTVLPDNKKSMFIDNVKKYKGENTVRVFDCDFNKVNISELSDIDLFFYDANHGEVSTAVALEYFAPCLADTSIVVFDDANVESVLKGVEQGVKNAGLGIIYEKKILNSQENAEQWWNGLYILVLQRQS
jgi:Methyltransferase domain